LEIELIPAKVWYSSIQDFCRKNKKINEWRKIKKKIIEEEGNYCWICGKEASRLEAHEFWEYNDKEHIQKLKTIHHLCSTCHKIKHIGLWCYTLRGKALLKKLRLTKEDLIDHFCKVNNCSIKDFEIHEREAFKIYRKRSKYKWKQDFGKYEYIKNKLQRINKKLNQK